MSLRRTTRAGRIAGLGLVLGSMVLGLALAGPAAALQDGEKRKDDREKARHLGLEGQKAKLDGWEGAWREAYGKLFHGEEEDRKPGLDATADLLADIHAHRDRITFVELRLRMERVEKQIQGEWPKIKWPMLERYQRRGLAILAEMSAAHEKKDHDAVVEMSEKELRPLVEGMIGADRDFIDVADDILAQGEHLAGSARAAQTVADLELQVVGIVIPEADVERTALIRYGKESPGDEPVPAGWRPAPRKYQERQAIVQLPGMIISRIHEDRVECVWKKKYRVDLSLKR